MSKNEIVFEDLHGINEEDPVEVDLDASRKDDGIQRSPADDAADDGSVDDDGIEISNLRDAKPASSGSDDDDDASTTGDDDDYSKKVKARIDREAKAKRKAQDEANYWRQQAENLAKKTSTQSKESIERKVEQATSKIESTLTALDAAIESGNTKDQVKLTSDLTDLKAEKIQAEIELRDLPESGNLQPFDGKVGLSSEKSLADQWMEDRNDWYGARGFERQTRLANRLDREVFEDGFDPKTAEYFQELDRRIKAKEPDLFDGADDDADDDAYDRGKRRPKRSPVAPVTNGDNNKRRGRATGKVELDRSDFANMRRFGLDTNNPEVLKEYARNKREAS